MPGAQEQIEEPNKSQGGAGAAGGEKEPTKDAGGQGAGGSGEGNGEGEADDLSKLSLEDAQKEIKKLRKENADRRVKGKTLEEKLTSFEGTMGKLKQALGIEDDSTTPEEKVKQLEAENSAYQLELGIRELAIQHAIPADNLEYFQFLFHKQLETLKEDEEMSEESLTTLVSKVKGISAQKQTSTGINGGGNPNPDKGGDVTVEKFSKMNVGERSEMYQKNPTLYNRLFNEANEKRLL